MQKKQKEKKKMMHTHKIWNKVKLATKISKYIKVLSIKHNMLGKK